MMCREAMMPGHMWAKLLEADWEIWDQLSDDVNITILNARSQLRSCPPTKPPPHCPDKRLVSLHDVIKACQHLTLDPREDSPDVDAMVSDTAAEEVGQGDNTLPSADLLTLTTNCQSTDHIPPAHLAKLMSDVINKHTSKSSNKQSVNASIMHYNTAPAVYTISCSAHVDAYGEALINSGSNGGLAGKEMHVIKTYDNGHTVDIEGIDQHCMCRIPLGSAGAVETQLGLGIAIVHNYTLIGQGSTIHSVGQIEAYHHCVHNKSIKVGGLQSIHTFDGYILPLNIHMGLLYLSKRPFTDVEWHMLPHIILMSEREWDPSCLRKELDSNEKWFDALSKEEEYPLKGIFNGESMRGARFYFMTVSHISL
jgi:hypothetical protein